MKAIFFSKIAKFGGHFFVGSLVKSVEYQYVLNRVNSRFEFQFTHSNLDRMESRFKKHRFKKESQFKKDFLVHKLFDFLRPIV